MKEECGIYIVRCGTSDFYKVGISRDVIKRLSGMQTDCPYELILIKFQIYPGNIACEEEMVLHRALEQYHIRREWFQLNSQTLKELFQEFTNLSLLKYAKDKICITDSQLNITLPPLTKTFASSLFDKYSP